MTLILSHGPWSITTAKLTDSGPVFEPHYILNERVEVDMTYRWNWRGQNLAGVGDCTFTFANLELHSLTTWSRSLCQRAWYEGAQASREELKAQVPISTDDADNNRGDDSGYVQIELSAQYFWERDLITGRALESWPRGA